MKDQDSIQRAVIKWCCPGFHGSYEEAGHRGGGVLVGRDFQGRPEFTLQYRAVDREDEQSVSSAVASLESPMALVVDIGMRYCPWCGCDLEEWYGETADSLYRPDLKITY